MWELNPQPSDSEACPFLIFSNPVLNLVPDVNPICAVKSSVDPWHSNAFAVSVGASFTEWFTSYVHSVVSGGFPIIREQIFRYVHDKTCVTRTGDIIISVSTSFLPELSSVHPPHYFFSYRIRIEMAKEAMPENACQLDSRYWKITNANGNVEEVQGPGVVGEFPVMRPGNVHEYTSCTTFTTPSGYMEGYYTFHRLSSKKDIFSVPIPRFHMRCPPSRGSAARQVQSVKARNRFNRKKKGVTGAF
uniref:F-box only protein 3-like n=1 Tax=Callorhinchus milii TaxID=7868 RepID=A0A4W3HG52_CALMI